MFDECPRKLECFDGILKLRSFMLGTANAVGDVSQYVSLHFKCQHITPQSLFDYSH